MTYRLNHRGPDGMHVSVYWGVTHGHARLAIRDPLPRSDQPFVYGDTAIAYVGEIWNADGIRTQLETEEFYVFETTGDTEVLAAWLDYCHRNMIPREDALNRLEGMYAFAVSHADGSFWLARDRYGKVPLYVQVDEGLMAGASWASERKAFDQPGAAVPVRPGHYWDPAFGQSCYYDVREAVQRRSERPPVDEKDVIRMLRTAVEERLQSDVPVCCLLSGGLDSSLILALAREIRPDIIAYAGVMNPESHDLAAARALCAEFGTELREVRIPFPSLDDLRHGLGVVEVVSKSQVEASTLCVPLAARLKEDGFKVCLSGEGADELFGGYGTLARRAVSDEAWREARIEFLGKMGRSDFNRVNKAFMAHGVECRTPFLSRPLVESVLALDRKQCPPGKKLLVRAAEGVLPESSRKRKKVTMQGAAGIKEHVLTLTPSPVKTFNQMAREVFGCVPRG